MKETRDYVRRTGCRCLNWMFEIIKNVKEGELTARNQCIIV